MQRLLGNNEKRIFRFRQLALITANYNKYSFEVKRMTLQAIIRAYNPDYSYYFWLNLS